MGIPTNNTLLSISGMGVAPYACRGLVQTLEPIDQATNLRRNCNGVLRDVTDPLFRKLKSTITGKDQRPPPFNAWWPGMQVTVDCCCYRSYVTTGGSADRNVVSGSSFTEGAMTLYRPQLVMRIRRMSVSEDEWNADVGWSLDLEEV